jgi:hypothetical protein
MNLDLRVEFNSLGAERICPWKTVVLTESKVFLAEFSRRFVVSLLSPAYSVARTTYS